MIDDRLSAALSCENPSTDSHNFPVQQEEQQQQHKENGREKETAFSEVYYLQQQTNEGGTEEQQQQIEILHSKKDELRRKEYDLQEIFSRRLTIDVKRLPVTSEFRNNRGPRLPVTALRGDDNNGNRKVGGCVISAIGSKSHHSSSDEITQNHASTSNRCYKNLIVVKSIEELPNIPMGSIKKAKLLPEKDVEIVCL